LQNVRIDMGEVFEENNIMNNWSWPKRTRMQPPTTLEMGTKILGSTLLNSNRYKTHRSTNISLCLPTKTNIMVRNAGLLSKIMLTNRYNAINHSTNVKSIIYHFYADEDWWKKWRASVGSRNSFES
jgi:hypothetical protein